MAAATEDKSAAAAASGEAKAVQVKSKASASLIPNNLTSNDTHIAYIHRNEVHLLKNSHTLLTSTEKASSTSSKCVYAEKDPVSQIRFCRLATLGADVLVVITVGGGVHIYDESGQRLIAFHKLTKPASAPTPAAGAGAAATGAGAAAAAPTPTPPGPNETLVASSKEALLRGIAHDGQSVIVVGSGTGELWAFGATSKRLAFIRKLPAHAAAVTDVTMLDGVMASGDETGNILLCNTREAKDAAYTRITEFKGRGEPVTSLALGYGYLVAAYSSGHIRLFNLESKTLAVEITAHTRSISAVDIHPSLPIFAAASEDSFVSFWSLPTARAPSIVSLGLVCPNTALLSGVRFVGRGASLVAATAYDSRFIGVVPTPAFTPAA